MPSVATAFASRFVREQLVGTGAFGEVFRGRDLSTGDVVAIKRLLAHRTDAAVVDRLEREARHLLRISSPFVVRCIDYGHDDEDRPCAALEWIDGEDLSRRQLTQPLDARQSLEVVRQAAMGVQALHDAGVLHRDVKPSNFLVRVETDGSLSVKLIDLGISRAIGDASLTLEGQRIGTPAYMSPEQARGDADVGPQSDVYALGVLLFELLTGQRPFRAEDPFAMLVRIVLEPPPRLTELLPGASDELDLLVARTLAKNPTQRFTSALALAEALGSVHAIGDVRASTGVPASTTIVQGAGVGSMLEQRVVTALFADVGETHDPALGSRLFEQTALAHGGEVHRMLGHKIVAVFGGSRTRGDEVLRAGRTALAFSQMPNVRVAIATCRAVTGSTTLLGDAIERGARDLDRASGVVRIDPHTVPLAERWFQLERDGDGVRLVGERVASDPPRTLLGVPTECVGRDRELAMLDAILHATVSDSTASVVLLTANAGSGKSRVRYEFLRRIAERDTPIEVLFGRGDPMRSGSAFGLIAQAVRRSAGILDGEPVESKREKLLARLARSVEPASLAFVSEFMGELVGVPFSDTDSESLRVARTDPVRMGDAMRAAWEMWLAAECDVRPVLLVLEDLHWGDVPTVTYASWALRSLIDRPFMVLALARPDVHQRFPDLWSEHNAQHIRVGALGRRAAEKLVRNVLGDTFDDVKVAHIVDRAEGNAFFLEELVRAVAEGTDGALPESVLGVLQSRLDSLSAEARFALRAASVFGQAFWRSGVATVLAGGDSDSAAWQPLLDRSLSELETREIISRRGSSAFAGEFEYGFRHSLMREAAYESIPRSDRALVHRLAGEWLERAGETDAMVLAEHYRLANDLRAARYYLVGASESLEGNDLAGAFERATQGLAADSSGETAGRLEVVLAEVARWQGDPVRAGEHGLRAVGLLEPATGHWLRAASEVITAVGRRGRTSEVLDWVARIRAHEPRAEAITERVVCLARAAMYLLFAGAGTEGAADELIDHIETLSSGTFGVQRFALAQCLRVRGLRTLMRGTPLETARGFEASVAAFDELRDQRNAALERVNLANALSQLGENARAESVARTAQAAGERLGLARVACYGLLTVGRALLQSGRYDESRAALRRARVPNEVRGDARLDGTTRFLLACIALEQGRNEDALADADASIAALERQPNLLAAALGAGALASLRVGDTREAVARVERVRELLENNPHMEYGEMYCRCAEIEVLESVGRVDAARECLRRALIVYERRSRDLDDPAMREAYRNGVIEHRRLHELAARLQA